MSDITLFTSAGNTAITKTDVINSLKAVGADDCDVLFIHTELNFGCPVKGLSRKDLMRELWSCIDDLGVKTVIFPVFTFSFCNQEDYDIQNTKSRMGILNEYVRMNVDGIRSGDPLLSVFVVGEERGLATNLSRYSIGKGSHYDKLHHVQGKVKFLFFGANMDLCFTYLHYVEEQLRVPFRYDREFEGNIIENGIERSETWTLFVKYFGVEMKSDGQTSRLLRSRNQIQEVPLGMGSLVCFDEEDGYGAVADILSANSDAMITVPFDIGKASKRFDYGGVISVK